MDGWLTVGADENTGEGKRRKTKSGLTKHPSFSFPFLSRPPPSPPRLFVQLVIHVCAPSQLTSEVHRALVYPWDHEVKNTLASWGQITKVVRCTRWSHENTANIWIYPVHPFPCAVKTRTNLSIFILWKIVRIWLVHYPNISNPFPLSLEAPRAAPHPFSGRVAFFLPPQCHSKRRKNTHTALAAVIRSKRVSEMCGWERKLKGGRDGAVRVIYLEGVSLLVRWLGYSGKKFVQQGSQSMDE